MDLKIVDAKIDFCRLDLIPLRHKFYSNYLQLLISDIRLYLMLHLEINGIYEQRLDRLIIDYIAITLENAETFLLLWE